MKNIIHLFILFFSVNLIFGQIRPSGSGTQADPYLISSADEFKWIAQTVNSGTMSNTSLYTPSYFEQTADIDFGGSTLTPIGGNNFNGSPYSTSTLSKYGFNGFYDGNFFTLSNFKIDTPVTNNSYTYIGLFGLVSNYYYYLGGNFYKVGGQIKNLKISNGEIETSTTDTKKLYAGILAGSLDNVSLTYKGVIENVVVESSTLSITHNSSNSHNDNIGGLIGNAKNGEITKTYVSSSTVFADMVGSIIQDASVGGLIGFNDYTNLSSSYFSNLDNTPGVFSIESPSANYLGGLIGALFNSGEIKENYSIANINHEQSGGRTGGLYAYKTGTNAVIKNNFSRVNIYGTSKYVGGFLGTTQAAYINFGYTTGIITNNCSSCSSGWWVNRFGGNANSSNSQDLPTNLFYNSSVNSSLRAGPDEEGFGGDPSDLESLGFSSSDLKIQSTFTNVGYDFSTIWGIDPSINDGFPYLKSTQYIFVQNPELTITPSDLNLSVGETSTITFTISKEVSTFTVDDIDIQGSGNIENTFTSLSSSTYEIVFTPPNDYYGTTTITINAGAIQDDLGNSNTQTKTIVLNIDTISPTLSSFTHDHGDQVVKGSDTVVFTATFTESMTSSPRILIPGDLADQGEAMTATTSSVWTYSWDVPNAKNGDFTATVTGTDLFGNYYSGTDSLTFRIDNVSPTLTITKPDGTYSNQSVVVTLTYSEAVTGLTTDTNDFSEAINVSSLTLLSASDDGTTYTVLITPTGDGLVKLTHAPGSPPVRDIAGNTISSTVSCSFIYDGSPPTINQITSPMADGTYTDYDGNTALSDTVTITVSFTESVTITGTPRVVLNTTPVTYANYHEGTGTATITFSATVAQEILQLALDVTALELNGGTITDLATNTASLTLAYVTSNSKNLDDLKNIKLDSKNPVLSNFAVTENNNLAPVATTSVKDGDQVTYGFQSDKELLLSSLTVTFTGFTPTLTTVTNGIGPFDYEISFTVSNTFPEGAVALQFSATDKVTTTLVPIGNPTGILTQAAFTDIIVIDRTAPTITSNANLTSDENTTTGPTITASENVFYSLIGGADQALLSINQNTGVLAFNTAPDFEAPIDAGADNTYEIIVKAIDWVGLTVTQTVNIQINDLNDTFGVLVTPTDVQTTESRETASIDFVLITQPTANVTIGLSLSDTTEGGLSATQLTFTPQSWNTTQTVIIRGVDDGLEDGDVTYQLITANTTSNDTTYNGLEVDDVALTNIDNEIDTDGDGFFDYQDAFPNDPTEWLDTDNDGVGNNTDLDDDGDGISDEYEIQLGTDPLDPNDTPSDFNANGIPDALEDSDGDGYNDDIDLYPLDPTRAIDSDGDGIADTDDTDDDNDGIPDDQDDFPLDSRYSKDTDNDGIPNLIDPDDDGDGYEDEEDAFPLDGTEHEDTDSDGIGNNADTDDDGDGITDVAEDEFITIRQVYRIEVQGSNKSNLVPIPKIPIERKNVGKWKVRKRISGGADRDQFIIKSGEPASPSQNAQQKVEESEGYLAFITPPDINNPTDHNRDNIYEVELSYINTIGGDERVPDPEYKGEIKVNSFELNVIELKSNPIPLEEAEGFEITSDLDADSINNSVDSDDDGDGILTLFEKGSVLLSEEDVLLDTDGDGCVDFQDPDDDNDGIFSQYEQSDPDGNGVPNDAADLDQDGIKNYLDSDDDGDGIPTFNENSDPNDDGNPSDAIDFDGDGIADYLDADDDNDGLPSKAEGVKDTDGDGNPDYHDSDDDNDGIATLFELSLSGVPLDTDNDGIIDPIDSDDDGDGLLTLLEDLNGNGDPRDDDTDSDGIPNYLESRSLDRDDDGVADEFDSVDDDPYNDQDGDGYPNMDEKLAGTNPLDPNSFPNGFFGALRASMDIVSFFSPNSDGINDTWYVKEIDRYPNNEVWIFTRNGFEVYNIKNYRNDWAGTQNGTPLPEGSYYYRMDLDGNGTIDFEGWLYLTR